MAPDDPAEVARAGALMTYGPRGAAERSSTERIVAMLAPSRPRSSSLSPSSSVAISSACRWSSLAKVSEPASVRLTICLRASVAERSLTISPSLQNLVRILLR
ncbi:hypothetical protein [Nonomuraea recticatena]|uniref:hypothetical protein n=1 Tax=Nonomuraea recticatena TaxID=46178 RepID=UPI00361E534D